MKLNLDSLVFWIVLSLSCSISCMAQDPVFFYNANDLLDYNFGTDVSIAVADVNGDYRDDLIRSNEDSIIVQVQLNNGTLFKTVFGLEIPFAIETTNVGDFDNDDKNDILVSGYYGGFLNFELNSGNEDFKVTQQVPGLYYAQGSNVHDVDNDGWLDAVITNDNGHNLVFKNNGIGILEEDESLIDFKLWSKEDAAGNYNAIWFDADNDDDLDLFISKCYALADDPNDLRRINQLFINDSLHFIERANDFGLDDGAQSWCADSGDLDNDGDIDLCVINHGAPSVIFENIGNDSFARHELFSTDGLIVSDDLQVTLADYNNDGNLDIAIAGETPQMLFNKGNLMFEPYYNLFGSGKMSSMAFGDLNHDGWLDILGIFGVFTIPNRLLLNLGGASHFLQLSLFGNISNRNGIGAKVEIFTDEGKQVRWVKSGTSYGITNSLNCHFGLNNSLHIDSLICTWPSGIVDKYYDIVGDKHYILNENKCMQPLIEVKYNASILDCENPSVIIESVENNNLIWSNGTLGPSLETQKEGFIQAYSNDGCKNTSNILYIDKLKPLIPPNLNVEGKYKICSNEKIIATSFDRRPIHWFKDGEDLSTFANQIVIIDEGNYVGKVFDHCDTLTTNNFQINYLKIEDAEIRDTFERTEDVILSVSGENVLWYDTNNNIIGSGNSIEPSGINADTLFYYSQELFPDSITFKAYPEIDSLDRYNVNDTIVGVLSFEILEDVYLNSIKVDTDIQGKRKILIIQSNDTIWNAIYDCEVGINKLDLNVGLAAGKYVISTDQDYNLENLGTRSPRLKSANTVVDDWPYIINGYVQLISSFNNSGDFGYFFNWDVSPVLSSCSSELIPYNIFIDSIVSTKDIRSNIFSLTPNPTMDIANWKTDFLVKEVKVLNLNGVELIVLNVNNSKTGALDLSALKSGWYLIQIYGEDSFASKKLIKI